MTGAPKRITLRPSLVGKRVAALVSALGLAIVLSVAVIAAPVGGREDARQVAGTYDTSRIVSIGGSITEILYALGLERRIAAVDTTSLYPPQALKDKPNVGYMRALSPEGVLGLNPSLILALDGADPKEAVAVLEAAKVPFIRVPEAFTAEGILAKIKLVATAVGAAERGKCLATAVAQDLDRLAKVRMQIEHHKRVMFVLSLANGRPLVAGRNTAADGIIRLAGGTNAIEDFDGYKPLNDEAAIGAKPDAILAMQRAGAELHAADVFALPAFALTPAAKSNTFISMEGLYLLGFGPRTARAASDLAHALYPSLGRGEFPPDPGSTSENCRP